MLNSLQQKIAILEKKVGHDARSPLFAQLANYYLEANRAQDALKLCDAGLAHFPFYTTGHLIKGKALTALNMRAEARREFEFVLNFLPKNETIASLLSQTLAEEATIIKEEVKSQTAEISSQRIITAPHEIDKEHTYTIPSMPVEKKPEPIPEITVQPPPPPIAEVPSGQSFFEAITQQQTPQPAFDESFNQTSQVFTESPTIMETPISQDFTPAMQDLTSAISEAITSPKEEQPSGFDLMPPEITPTSITITGPSITIDEESFQVYATTKRMELSGENTISLEDYLNNVIPGTLQIELPPIETAVQPQFEEPKVDIEIDFPQTNAEISPVISLDVPESTQEPPTLTPTIQLPGSELFIPPPISDEADKIEELAAKLQSAKKITPNIDLTPDLPPVIDISEKETAPASQEEGPPIGFVTPTLAEIYAKQGWYDDAIKAYRTLIKTKPAEKERFENRIAELEEMKNKAINK